MCGIAGIVSLVKPVQLEQIEQMTDVIKHRGPDGFGHKCFGNVALGHRRLSIIDLSSGGQPMCDDQEKLWITYNGELYNYQELKEKLMQSGCVFRSSSDTEVIIYAYKIWGEKCLNYFRGMFSFAIVDTERKRIFAARDHFGIKPFYYHQGTECVAFGSELQQFRNLPGFDADIDLKAIDQYLWLQYIPAPLTVFTSVKKLKAAHYIFIDFEGKVSEQIQYWDLSFAEKKSMREEEWVEAAEEVIEDSVKAHLVSDVPFGAFLSGGIDSSLVVKYMTSLLNRDVDTFSIGFDEKEYNELPYSKIVAEKFGTRHHTEIVKPDALSILPDLVRHYGEPYGDSSCIPTYYVCKLAKRHVTMVLSGDGGDEGFAGYNSYTSFLQHLPGNYRQGIKKALFPAMEFLFPQKYPSQYTLPVWVSKMSYLEQNWRSQLWLPEFQSHIVGMPEGFEEIFARTRKFSGINKFQYLDMKTYMNFDILTKVDVASMMHSLEVRTPLIDKKVWEFAASIPETFNIRKVQGEYRGKIILKKILQKSFSDEFVHRRKQGFGVPISKWFARDGELNMLLQERILSNNSSIKNYFNQPVIDKLIEAKHSGALWLILFLEEWLNQFKK